MKIGIDISQAIYGTGVSKYTVNLVKNLPRENIVLFGSSFSRQLDLRRIFPTGNVFPFPPNILDLVWNRLHIFKVENLIGKVDVFHSSDWTQPPTDAKKVTTVHDLTPFLYPQEMDPLIVTVHKRRMQWVVQECDKIICVSQNTANDLQRLFSVADSRIVIIPEAMEEQYKLKSQVIKHTNYLLTIGARQPRKNIQRLIKACEILKQKLIVIGEPPAKQASSNRVIFTGYVSDQELVNYMAGAMVFVYPSLYEGFGLPILGAFYHNVPVVTSNSSAMPEVAGEAAVLVDPYSEESIANGITEAIRNRDKLIIAGKKQLAKFSWQKTADETLKVYQALC